MKKILWIGLMGFLAMTGAAAAATYGVFVGLNQYNTSYVGSDNWLNGCVPDAMHIYTNTIKRGNWTAGTVTLLTNSLGTKAAIRRAITNRAATAVSGDVFFYYHSSHGGNNSDPYGKSVYLCSYDADYQDTELATDLAKFATGVKVIVMIDACHSGGLFVSSLGTRTLASTTPGSWDVGGRVMELMAADRATKIAAGAKGLELTVTTNEIGWITAANYDQYSWDGDTGGLFTDKVIEGWTNAAASSCDLNSDGYANFWELYKYASNVAYSADYEYTTAMAANTNVLLGTIAGWIGSAAPGGLIVFSNIVAQTVTVGQTLTYPVGAYTSGTNTPAVVTMTTVQAGASYGSGQLSFTPTADGSYTFNFSATNATGGSASASLTVTASLAAPTLSSATGIGNDRFTANWSAVSGAASYKLDVATNSSFSAGGSGASGVIVSNINSGLSTGWEYVNGASNAGTYHKLVSASGPGLVSAAFSTVGYTNAEVGFSVATFGGTSANALTVSYSLDGGGSWTPVGTNTSASASSPYVSGSISLPEAALGQASVRVKWHCAVATASVGLRLQNAVVTGAQPAGGNTMVLNGQGVTGTTYTVTGLAMGSTYYYRVKAVGNATGPASATGTVTTTSADTAPSFSAISGQSATVGALFTLNVSGYVSGSPAPVISLSSSTASASDYSFASPTLSFTPSTTGVFAFVFRATNTLGTAMVTASVTAAAAPVYVPTASIANLSSNSFTVNWTAITGGSTYQVQVATDTNFSGGGSGGTVVLATNAANTNIAPEGWTYNISASSGSYLVLGYATNYVQSPVFSTVGKTTLSIDFKARTYGGVSTVTNAITVSISTNGGSNWTDVGTVIPTTSTLTSYGALDASAYVGYASVCVKWQAKAAGSNKGAGIQALSVTGTEPSGSSSLVLDQTVSALSYPVSGLTPATRYYVRVRGTGGTWSEVVSATTKDGSVVTPTPQPICNVTAPTNGCAMGMHIATAAGVTYALQYTTNLLEVPPVWVQVDSKVGTGSDINLQDADSAGGHRYYRVVKP